MNERALQSKVLKYLRKVGGVWINKSPSPWDKEGISDILGCYAGRFVAIELKSPVASTKSAWGRCTDAQRHFLEKVREAGGAAFAADSLEEVLDQLALWGIALEPPACYRNRRSAGPSAKNVS